MPRPRAPRLDVAIRFAEVEACVSTSAWLWPTSGRRWWALQCAEHPGAISQVARLDQVQEAMREAIGFVAQVDPASIDITLRVELPSEEFRAHQRRANELREQARAANEIECHAICLSGRERTVRKNGSSPRSRDAGSVRCTLTSRPRRSPAREAASKRSARLASPITSTSISRGNHPQVPEPDEELAEALAAAPKVLRLSDALAGLPSTYIENAEFDAFRASGSAFARLARTAGANVVEEIRLGVPHAHLDWVGLEPAHESLGSIATFLTAAFGG